MEYKNRVENNYKFKNQAKKKVNNCKADTAATGWPLRDCTVFIALRSWWQQ